METETLTTHSTDTLRLATFYIEDLLLGLPIELIHEINRCLDITMVPHAPDWVRGVVNLRGEVVTVVDLRKLLGFPSADATALTRNLIVDWHSQRIGLIVDQVADVVDVTNSQIMPTPANVRGVDGRMFNGVIPLDQQLVVLLDLTEAFREM